MLSKGNNFTQLENFLDQGKKLHPVQRLMLSKEAK